MASTPSFEPLPVMPAGHGAARGPVDGRPSERVAAARTSGAPTARAVLLHASCHSSCAGDAGALARARWLRAFERDDRAAITEHPDYVLLDASDARLSRGGGITVLTTENDEPPAAAVLVPKRMRTSSAGGLGPSWTLDGYRLVGDRVLGRPDDDAAARLVRAAIDLVRRERADFLLCEDLDEESALYRHLSALRREGLCVLAPTGFQARHRLVLPRTMEELWSAMPGTQRKKLRRELRLFEGGRVLRAREARDVRDFVACAHAVSKRSWQAERLGVRVRDDEAERERFSFVASKGALRSYLLLKDDRPVAFTVGHQWAGRFVLEEIGFDRAFARSSPGTVLLLRVLEDLLAEDRPEIFDFGFGDALYKRQLANRTTRSATVLVLPDRLGARATAALLQGSAALRARARSALAATGLYARLRALSRSRPSLFSLFRKDA